MKYYAMIDGRQKGPFEPSELPAAGVRPSTYVWCKGMSDWEKAEDVADVCRFFRNHLYDIMHPGKDVNLPVNNPVGENDINNVNSINLSNNNPQGTPRSTSRFDSILKGAELPQLPTIEEIDSKEQTDRPPVSMTGYAWIVTLFFFFPTGIIALYWAYRSKKAWLDHDNKTAHDCCRAAKMWTGVSFFMGLIFYAFLIRFF